MILRVLTLCTFLLTTHPYLQAQTSDDELSKSPFFGKSSYNLLAGGGFNVTPLEGPYRLYNIMGQWSWRLNWVQPSLGDFHGLEYFFEWEWSPGSSPDGFEMQVGLNGGLRYQVPLFGNLDAFVMGSSGPHIITAAFERQRNGFLFSSQSGIGLSYRTNRKDQAINVQARIRHVSNAGLANPNAGINTFHVVLGYRKWL
ncbi:MAG: acyloxyacyl hydrolase [Bacteroidota bacterium]